MNDIILYTTDCSKCTVLKNKLIENDIVFTENRSKEEMRALGMMQAPMLSVNGRLMGFPEALKWASSR